MAFCLDGYEQKSVPADLSDKSATISKDSARYGVVKYDYEVLLLCDCNFQ